MNVLITGASGFIGLPVVQHLKQERHNVLALSRSIPNGPARSSVNWVEADLSLPETYKDTIQEFEPEILIHLAWQGIPDFSFETSRLNLWCSLDLLSFVVGLGSCRKILVSGSCLEFNRLKGECKESEIGTPIDDFTWAKHSVRSWSELICAKEKIDLAWLRIFYVYGPRQRQKSLVPSILNHLKSGHLPDLRTPQHSNDFIFVDDVAKAFSNLVLNEFSSGIYNLGSGYSTPIIEICRIAEQIVLGTESLTRKMEEKTQKMFCNVDFWAGRRNINKALELGPATDLGDGIEKTWNWLISN